MEAKTILLVDDDYDYLFQQKIHLESWGFNVVTAETQAEAEEVLDKMKPDLAILDLMMETDDSGFILAWKIKRKYPDTRVIISTAVSAETGMSFGVNTDEEKGWIKADLYLEKGIRPEQFKMEIEKLLK
jgi:two-component system, OmpR family, response regulator